MIGVNKSDYREWCVRFDGKIGYISKQGYLTEHSEMNLVTMQCTNLKDKHGKLIFEGDIVVGHYPTGTASETMQVEFGIRGAIARNKTMSFHLDALNDCEVIGNIFENADLLTSVTPPPA